MDTEIEELEEGLCSDGLSIDVINDIIDDNIEDTKSKEGKPYVDMEFNSEEDAMAYYNRYAKSERFGICKGPAYKSIKKSMVTARSFCCSHGGNPKVSKECNSEETSKDEQGNSFNTPKKNVTTTKFNCKAHIRVKLEMNGKWKVTAFEEEHSHPLVSPEKVKFYRSHRRIPQEVKDMIVTLRNENAPIKQIMSLVTAQLGGTKNVSFISKDVSNYAGSAMRSLFGNDVSTTLEYFQHLQAEDPSFFYAIKSDDFGRAQNIFWVDGRSCLAYQYFGDVITFDTTYMTNKYSMPFAPFVGTNHHWQSILFGCALIRDEQASSFEWIFNTWLEAMGGNHPKAILTDQDLAMKKAIATVFPDAKHRCCEWHILRKAREKIGSVHRNHSTFGKDLQDCVDNALMVEDFEAEWNSLVSMYGLEDHDHMKYLFDIRHEWVPVYFRDTFYAHMSTTQRSESMNAIFDGYVNSHTSIYLFVKQFEKVLQNRFEKEDFEDFRTVQVKPILWSSHPLEKHASTIYTRKLFKRFQANFKDSLSFDVEEHGNGIYNFVHIKDKKKSFTVKYDASNEMVCCNCKLFESSGILCTHMLEVLRKSKMQTIPLPYILKRWTKSAKKGLIISLSSENNQAKISSTTMRYNSICQNILKLAGEGCMFLETYEYIINSLQETYSVVSNMKEKLMMERTIEEINHPTENATCNEKILDPPASKCKGRPRNRFKSPLDNYVASRKRSAGSTLPDTIDRDTDAEYPSKRTRTCSKCGTQGHDVRTCKEQLMG